MPLQQAIEAFIKALYRSWYGLPRRSTRDVLERMRADLATDLAAAFEASDDDTVRTLALDFVRTARKLPGVEEVTGKELSSLGIFLGSSLKPKLTDPETIITLLSAPNPAATAIREWHFIPGREAATLTAVRDKLEVRLGDFPAETQTFLQDIFARVDQKTFSAADAMVELEQSDDVLRVAWLELLPGKTDKIVRTLGGPPSPPTVAAAPASDESSVGQGISTPYFTDIRFPRKIKRSERQPLLIRLTKNQHPESIASDVVPIVFEDPKEPKMLEVVLTAPGFDDAFTEKGSAPRRTMIVRHEQDSDPIVFWLKADEVGEYQISVGFYHQDKYLGGTQFSVEVIGTGQTSVAQIDLSNQDSEIEPRFDNLPQPADLEIRVAYNRKKQQLSYMLHSTIGEATYHFADLGTADLPETDATTFFADSFGFMGRISAYDPADLSAQEVKDFVRQIEAKGEELFETLLSPEMRAAYWDIKTLRERDVINSVLITTDEPWIPWEWIKPYAYDEVRDEEKKDTFWGETFQVSRWLNASGPFERINVENASLILPNTDLVYTEGEGADFALMKNRGVNIGEPISCKADVLQVLTDGSAQLMHFATHASFNAEKPDESSVTLEDDVLRPTDLDNASIRVLRRVRPIIFFNACQSGLMGYKLSGMDGWASRLVQKVRATAFIGTQWEVHDKLAAQFSAKFYSELLAGKALGAAFQSARLHIRELAPANPTWLAYTLYGDPNTRVTWGPPPADDK